MSAISVLTVKCIGRRPPILLCKQGLVQCFVICWFFEISIFVTTNNIKSCRCIWFCSSVQTGAKKRKQVPSSTKLGLGETFVLQLMECLTPAFSFDIFMDNYFISFRLLEVNNIRAASILDKNSIHKCAVI